MLLLKLQPQGCSMHLSQKVRATLIGIPAVSFSSPSEKLRGSAVILASADNPTSIETNIIVFF